jgi:hypothetical protein
MKKNYQYFNYFTENEEKNGIGLFKKIAVSAFFITNSNIYSN